MGMLIGNAHRHSNTNTALWCVVLDWNYSSGNALITAQSHESALQALEACLKSKVPVAVFTHCVAVYCAALPSARTKSGSSSPPAASAFSYSPGCASIHSCDASVSFIPL